MSATAFIRSRQYQQKSNQPITEIINNQDKLTEEQQRELEIIEREMAQIEIEQTKEEKPKRTKRLG